MSEVKSLHAVIVEAGRLEEPEVRRYAHSLFRTLGQVHDSGLVVRDIKPDNILVDSYGDLVLSDFGISEIMQTTTHVAQSQLKGTFAYMSPEAFSAKQVGPPLDNWAMACVVLEMYTGEVPWRGMQMQQIMYAVCVDRRVPEVPADAPAADLLQRCFAYAPEDRPKAIEVAQALAPNFEPAPAQPVIAQLEQRCEELQAENDKLVQENGDLKQQMQAQQEITEQITEALTAKTLEVERQAARIKALEEEMRAVAEAAALRSAAQEVHAPLASDSLFDMVALSTKLSKPDGVHDVLGEVYQAAQVASGQAAEHLKQLHHCLGRHLPILKKPPRDMRATLLQLASQEPAGSRVLREAEKALQRAQELQCNLIEWTNKPRQALPCVMEICEHSRGIYAVAVSPDGNLIASGSADNTVVVVEAGTGRVRQTLRGHRREVTCLDFSSDNKHLASGSWDNSVRIWDIETGACLNTFKHNRAVNAVAFNPKKDNEVVSASNDSTIKVWSLADGQCKQTLDGHGDFVRAVAFNPKKDNEVVSASDDCTLKVWSLADGQCKETLRGHDATVSSIAFKPRDSNILVSASWDKSIKVWHLPSGKCQATFEGHSHIVSCLDFSSDNKRLASGSYDKTVRIWDMEQGICVREFAAHSNVVSCIAFDPKDNDVLVSGSWDNTLKKWRLSSGDCLATYTGHSGSVRQVEFRDGATLVSASEDGSIKVWDVSTGASKHEAAGDQFAFSKRAGREQHVGRFLVKAEAELVVVHDGADDSGETKPAVAFFRAPSPVSAIDCASENIAVGCKSGAVLHLRAAWLASE